MLKSFIRRYSSMLRFEKFEQKHITDVKRLYDTYLLPKHLKRLGITKEEVTKEIIELESLVDPKYVSSPHLLECSMVCIDEHNMVIACQLNYFLEEEKFTRDFVTIPKKYLSSPNVPKNIRDYAQYVVDLYDGHDIFRRCKRFLYLECGITIPEYRHQDIAKKLWDLSIDSFTGEVDGLLGEPMIETDNSRHLRIDDDFVLLRRIQTPDYVCGLYVNYLNK